MAAQDSAPARPQQRRLTKNILYALGILCIIPVLVFPYFGFLSTLNSNTVPGFREVPSSLRPAPTSFRRDPGEYVLDATWDVAAAPTTRHYNWVVSEVEGSPDGESPDLLHSPSPTHHTLSLNANAPNH